MQSAGYVLRSCTGTTSIGNRLVLFLSETVLVLKYDACWICGDDQLELQTGKPVLNFLVAFLLKRTALAAGFGVGAILSNPTLARFEMADSRLLQKKVRKNHNPKRQRDRKWIIAFKSQVIPSLTLRVGIGTKSATSKRAPTVHNVGGLGLGPDRIHRGLAPDRIHRGLTPVR
jgi:hypothetical protein